MFLNRFVLRSLALSALGALILPVWASPQSDELADCIYANITPEDRTVLVQWAFVTIGRSEAARQIADIPNETRKAVDGKARRSLTRLLIEKCPKPTGALLISDPRGGLQDTIHSLAEKVVAEEIEKRSERILKFSLTDFLK